MKTINNNVVLSGLGTFYSLMKQGNRFMLFRKDCTSDVFKVCSVSVRADVVDVWLCWSLGWKIEELRARTVSAHLQSLSGRLCDDLKCDYYVITFFSVINEVLKLITTILALII